MNKGENIFRVLLAVLSLICFIVVVYGWLNKVDGWWWFLIGTFVLIYLLACTYEDSEAHSDEEGASE